MIFNMMNFKDIVFFYLYGTLNMEVTRLYPDNL